MTDSTNTNPPAPGPARYLRPSRADQWTAATLRTLVHLGIGPWGARELRVRGRKSGRLRSTVVNLLQVGDQRYIVAPRGATEWVRNLRAAGSGELWLGRRCEKFDATELPDEEKAPVLKAYLDRWAFEVGRFFEGLHKGSSVEELAGFASSFPVFRVVPASN
ncbi:MAG TPA: nitroreductase family deazaflavin-dependent oxidoreductase [Acidimicrobiales bacterium]|nr:nitroreductase family deazaflavin-dependent oxidoreductase [Acidimicrobiales bacterium]